ncbi:MAG: magnesium/cobalt transporter CorA [Mycobacteriaceae bacterium]
MPVFPSTPPIPAHEGMTNPTTLDDAAVVDCGVYLDGHRLPGKFSHAQALAEVQKRGHGFVWIGLHSPDELQMSGLATAFGLHELAVEDVIHAHQRPKLERYDNTLFFVLRTVNYVDHVSISQAKEIVETGEIMIFIGPDFVITVRHGDHSGLAGVRRSMDKNTEQLALGPSAVLHAIADHVVDSYLAVTDAIEDDIDTMEESVFSPTGSVEIEQIYLLKREVVELRRAVTPLATALQKFVQDHTDMIPKEVRRYMRDVVDHHTIVAERVAAYDEVLSSLVNAALGKVTLRQNADMRKISSWVAIASVPTMIAGIYGMNFENMPELSWGIGYPAILTLMTTICSFLYVTFRRNHWL